MSYIEDLRNQFPELSQISDTQLISLLPRLEPEQFGNLSQEQLEYAATNNDSQFTKGFKGGIDQLQAMGGGLAATMGDFADATDLKQWGLDTYNENMQEASLFAPEVEGVTEIEGVEDALDWAGYTLGNLVPTMATALAGGGVGGIIGKQAAKHAAANLMKKELAKGVTKEVAAKTAGNLIAKRIAVGQGAGAFATTTGMETGSIYGETGEADVAAIHGAVAGVFDALPVARILGKFGLSGAVKEQVKRSVTGEILKQGAFEGGTEALQTLVEQHAKYWVDSNGESLLNNLGEVNTKEIINAAAAGALGGGVMGGGVGIVTRNPMQDAQDRIRKAGEGVAAKGGDALDQAVAQSEEQGKVTPEAVNQAKAAQAATQTAEDLGVQFKEYETPDISGQESSRDMSGIDGLIISAERLGFHDEASRLRNVKKLYERAEGFRSRGEHDFANRLIQNANKIYRDITETNEPLRKESANFPVPFVSEGEIQVGDLAAVNNPNWTQPDAHIDSTANEIIPELELSGAKLPPSTDQINLGREYTPPQAQPVDPLYDGVGENVVQRQAPVTGLPQPGVSQEQIIDIQNQERAPAQDMAGIALDQDWSAFAADTETKGVPRAEMPQIKAEHRGAMTNFMNARGIAHEQQEVLASELKPTQAEFSHEKVKKAMEYEGGDRSILVSADGYVLDGHHQWLAKRELGQSIKIIRLDAPIDKLIPLAHEFPSSEVDGVSVPSSVSDKAESEAQTDLSTESETHNWREYGFSFIGTRSGKPFKTESTARNSDVFANNPNAEIISVDDGYKIKIGSKMTADQAEKYIAEFDKERMKTAHPMGNASANHKPLSVTSPELFDKKEQAMEVLGQHYWQQPYSKVKRNIPLKKWESERLKRGLPVDDVPGNIEVESSQKAITPQKEQETQAQPANKIEDFGEKIGGARKDEWAGFRESLVDEIDTKTVPLSKSFPEPDYKKLSEAGADPEALALIALLRNSIPSKPRKSYRVKSWADKVDTIRNFAKDMMNGSLSPQMVKEMMLKTGEELGSLARASSAIAKIDPSLMKQAAKYKITKGYYSYFRGQHYKPSKRMYMIEKNGVSDWDNAFESQEEAEAYLLKLLQNTKIEEKGKTKARKSALDVYTNSRSGKVYIGWKGASGVLNVQDGFESPREARAYLNENHDEVEAKLAEIKNTPSMRRSENNRRSGPERRQSNVTPELFADTFGFRGVEFGNWVENSKRQQDLNEAYDGLIDLAEILEIPPKALSLNGELGLAFGARGKGGKNSFAAHYEPGKIVINLTKKAGPGSLAHEWWHSMDNYFSRMRNDNHGFTTDRPYELMDKSVRPEVLKAFKGVMQAINMTDLPARAAEIDKTRSKAYWATNVELSARAFESFVIDKLKSSDISNDYLANVVSEEAWGKTETVQGSYPYPTESELESIKASYQKLFDVIETKETDSGVAMFSRNGADSGDNRSVLSVDAVEAVASDIARRLRLRGVRINTVATEADLPAAILEQAAEHGAEGEIGAVLHQGSIYLVADKMPDATAVEAAIWHESAHYGGRTVFGKDISKAYRKLAMRLGGVKGIRAKAEELGVADLMAPYFESAKGMKSDAASAYLIDELLSHANQLQASEKFPARIKRSVQEFFGAIRDTLRRWNFKELPELTDSDLAFLLKQINKAAQEGEGSVDAPQFMRVSESDELSMFFADLASTVDDQPAFSRAESGFSAFVEGVLEGVNSPRDSFNLGNTPAVLQALGAKDLPININGSVINKAIKHKHDITPEIIKNLSEQLSNPVMVFDSSSRTDGLVVLTELFDPKGRPVVVAIHLEKQQGRAVVNNIASVHGKDGAGKIKGWVQQGLLAYRNKRKSRSWLRQTRLQLPWEGVRNDLRGKVITESDIVKPSDNSIEEDPAFSRVANTEEQSSQSIRSTVRDVIDSWRFQVQDKFIDLKRKQQEIGEVDDDANAYQKAAIWEGKAGEQLNDFDEQRVQPLLEQVASTGLDLDQVGEWLVARHAEEANKYLAEINPDKPEDERYRLSGMSNEEAAAILEERQGNTELQELGKTIDQINRDRVSMLVDRGLISQSDADAWQGRYEHYVPLKREEADEGFLPSRGQGFSMKGKESKQRTGSAYWTPGKILSNVIANYEQSIIRSEKNEVGKALLKFVEQNPDDNFWTVVTDRKRSEVRNGKVIEVTDNREGPADFSVKVDGVQYMIEFNTSNEKSKRLVEGLKNLQVSEMGSVMRGLASVTRFLATINTSWNPEFMVSNFFRDAQTAAYNLSDTELKDMEGRVLKDIFPAMNGIRNALFGDSSSEWADVWEDFRKSGGKTGWLDLHSDIQAKEQDLKKMVKRLQDGKPSKMAIMRFIKGVEDMNNVIENAVRLSAYKHALEAGLSKDKAAALAKDLTVNFNRKGNKGPMINALYMFFNAAIQGNVRLLQAMVHSKKGRVLALSTVGFAVMLDMINRSLSGEDDDGENIYDTLPDHIKDRNIIIMGEKEPIIKIPAPWGYNVLHVLGQEIGSSITNERFDPLESGSRAAMSVVDAFNPVGSGTFLQMVSPTVLDPAVQISENKNFFGSPLRPEHTFDAFRPRPEYQMHFSNARETSKDLTKWLNDISGGNEIRPGAINWSPEVVDMLWDTVTGGLGRTVADTGDFAGKLISGDELEVSRIPFVRKVTGANINYGVKGRYYEWSRDVGYASQELKQLKGKDLYEARRSPQFKLIGLHKATEKKLRSLRKTRKALVRNNASEERIEKIDENIRKVMAQFNKQYAKVVYKG